MEHPWIQKYARKQNIKDETVLKNALQNIQSYKAENEIQKAVYMIMIQYIQTQEQKD